MPLRLLVIADRAEYRRLVKLHIEIEWPDALAVEHRLGEDAPMDGQFAAAGFDLFRRSVTGQPRGPLCGMGICFECRVTVGGRQHVRSCQTACASGMEVQTDE